MTPDFHVFIVSDGTGLSAETAARAALAQFPRLRPAARFHRFTEIGDVEVLTRVVEAARDVRGAVFHTLARRDWAGRLRDLAGSAGVPEFDLLHAAVSVVEAASGETPLDAPSPRRLDEAYFRRVEAMEWTVRHDDGREPANLRDAEIVLVGVSRTSKTPLSIYLANRGYRVANVPVVLGVPVPSTLARVSRERVFGLRIDASVLLEIRQNRVRQLGSTGGEYADPQRVQEELDYAEDVFRAGRFTALDVTGRAVEETAAEIERLLERRLARG
ncbi:pyruvate, water dikinase regulatory protein [Deinococcus pimensis]|uniref:pyruvate, water dikinase regulatory protein n=1 Tax=Deinococcus pimensis TaxID=309888 RepID=UPI000480E143|nr:pyruvate, phosphate dikinase/phosphoenolpyruvate synthase regulator [Deinococcus pimensis]